MESSPHQPTSPKLLDQLREKLRLKHYSIRTEQQYIHWARRYILFHNKRHPRDMGAVEVSAFPTNLAVQGRVAAATQNQALSALLFLYREILDISLPWLDEVVRAKRPAAGTFALAPKSLWKRPAERPGIGLPAARS